MNEPMTPQNPTHLPPWLQAHRRLLLAFAATAAALIVLAWLLPIPNPEATAAPAERPLTDIPKNPPSEDLAAFLDVKRWGLSLREINARIAEEEAQRQGRRPDLNPALKALGYVGLVVEADANTVLLTTAEGTVARLEPGDPLPDGRILAAVAGHSITLREAGSGAVEVLELFPRPPAEADAGKEAQ